MNQLGDEIRRLREQKGFLQRQIASLLEIDTPMLSKIERGERNAKREHILKLSKFFNVPEDDLLSLWIADKLIEVVKDEKVGLKSIEFVHSFLEKELNLIHK
ncbi:MAG: helix-turn-helix transcriptional regulator [Sediminibacterium sp.]|jgi:transcriptional regulator with XRE-family HTH domain|uniref:helix-turn-helix domain-containing protein n=1 Tax=Sediminibacterium sp. TaxID=1917865 RepID=UPI002727BB94|nr:helix-turn-helix transcriptional regulator [Sediminibacterium sp.]MDO8996508.1 helix-turn-helix transcriptional regulator [Sediminibacterium sp.]